MRHFSFKTATYLLSLLLIKSKMILNMDNLGNRIQELRKANHISQLDMAKKVSISKAQLSRYENQGIQPPADILNKIATILNTSVDYLINGNTDEKAKATLKNADLLKQFREVEELPEDEQKVVVKFIGAYLRDYKTKKAYAS